MKHINSLWLLILTLTVILMYSCQNEDFTEETSNISETESLSLTQLGDELKIPYTTENMTKAFEQVIAHLDESKVYGKSKFAKNSKFSLNSKTAKSIEILPSHHYYRFLPKDSLEYETLVRDTILSVANVPLHREVIEEGDAYDDPNIVGDEMGEAYGWLYSVVPFDYEFPSEIQHEKLEDMYFAPELDEDIPLEEGESKVYVSHNKTTKSILSADKDGEVFEYLELEALKLTENLDEEELEVLRFYLPDDTSGVVYSYAEATEKGYKMPELIIDYNSVLKLISQEGGEVAESGKIMKRRRWTPSGRITVEEGALTRIKSDNNIVGVMGAEVRVRKWGFLVIRKGRTDRNGNFSTRRTRTKRVKYAVFVGK
jgi:hypothetical protein